MPVTLSPGFVGKRPLLIEGVFCCFKGSSQTKVHYKSPRITVMIGTLGQFVREIRDLLTGTGSPIPVDIGTSIDVSIDNTSLEISNDAGNPIPTIQGLEIPAHDYIALSYTGANLTGVVYKDGGSGGTTVATLTLAYDGSNNLTSVTKS